MRSLNSEAACVGSEPLYVWVHINYPPTIISAKINCKHAKINLYAKCVIDIEIDIDRHQRWQKIVWNKHDIMSNSADRSESSQR